MNEPDRPDRNEAPVLGRKTPYELVFQSDEFEARVFPRIQDEASAHAVEPLLPEQFNFLTLAGDAVRDIVPQDAPPEALEQHRALLFHAFNFWRFGKRVYVLEPALARYLVEAAPSLVEWEFDLPHPSVYVQLPANLFWSSISTDSPPEPVDGFFVASSSGSDALGRSFRRLDVLAVLGIRRNRAGFSVVPFSTEIGSGIAAVWAETPARDDGEDFQSVLPGGDLARLYSILTTGEILKLLARVFWYVGIAPEHVTLERVGRDSDRAAADSPPPPRLPYHRVSLSARVAPEGGS